MEQLTKYEEVKALFPIKFDITKEIIDNSIVVDLIGCIGANSLRKALGDKIPENARIVWYNNSGSMVIDGEYLHITTEELVDMMDVTKPQSVTFIVNEVVEAAKLPFSDSDLHDLLDAK